MRTSNLPPTITYTHIHTHTHHTCKRKKANDVPSRTRGKTGNVFFIFFFLLFCISLAGKGRLGWDGMDGWMVLLYCTNSSSFLFCSREQPGPKREKNKKRSGLILFSSFACIYLCMVRSVWCTAQLVSYVAGLAFILRGGREEKRE